MQYPSIDLDFPVNSTTSRESLDAILILFVFGIGVMYAILGTQFQLLAAVHDPVDHHHGVHGCHLWSPSGNPPLSLYSPARRGRPRRYRGTPRSC